MESTQTGKVLEMSQVLNYNIHDILKFQIVRSGKFDLGNLSNLRFSCFETAPVAKPDIVLNIGRFTPANENCYLVDYKYYIKDNYFYCRESEGKASWEVEIKGLEQGDTIINFHVSPRLQIKPAELVRAHLFYLTVQIRPHLNSRRMVVFLSGKKHPSRTNMGSRLVPMWKSPGRLILNQIIRRVSASLVRHLQLDPIISV